MLKWYIENMVYATGNLITQIGLRLKMHALQKELSKYDNPQVNYAKFFI